jgi:hypothetical protein
MIRHFARVVILALLLHYGYRRFHVQVDGVLAHFSTMWGVVMARMGVSW